MGKKKRIASIIAIIVAMTVALSAPVYAEKSTGELRDDLKEAKKDVQNAKNKYSTAKASESAISEKIQSLTATIRTEELDLAGIQREISANNDKIKKEKSRIKKLEKQVGKQKNRLNKRLRAMYLAGDMSILEVLLGSQNIVDFLQNVDMVKRIHSQDVRTVKKLNKKLKEVEKRKKDLLAVKKQLSSIKQSELEKKARLEANKRDLDVELTKAHKDTIAAWNAVENTQAASDAIQKELQSRRSKTKYGGGKLGWPVRGIITSEFGMRRHPISGARKMHNGLDIAAPYGTPVHAAADGEVIFSGWNSGGYGNLVMIDHGSNIVTCYGHNSSLSCKVGQHVKRGDVIARIGSTGDSTGPHCHFEVRVSGVPQNPRNWL